MPNGHDRGAFAIGQRVSVPRETVRHHGKELAAEAVAARGRIAGWMRFPSSSSPP
jgi:hypothetical protein